jgi:branched-chain amino acid transport system permease protein
VLSLLLRPVRAGGGGVQGTTVFAILAFTASTMLLMGWLLPWFVAPTSSGIGFSPQDVVVSSPNGIDSVLVYPLAAGFLYCLLGALRDAAGPAARLLGSAWRGLSRLASTYLLRQGPPVVVDRVADGDSPTPTALAAMTRPVRSLLSFVYRSDRVRLAVAVSGLVITSVIWLIVRVTEAVPNCGASQTGSAFGCIDSHTVTDSAVWLTMYGYALAALTYGARGWVLSRPNLALGVAVSPFGLLLPFMFHQAPDFLFWAASSLAVYMLLALGLNVVVGFAGLLDLGYAAFFAIGAYACASLSSAQHDIHLPLWALIFVGAAVASVFGAVLGAPTLRLRGDYLAIVTLGFGEIIPDLATNNVFDLTRGPTGISGIDQPVFGPINFATGKQWYYWSLLLISVIVIILLRNIERSRVGRAWVALREDEVAAAATGINTTTTKLLAFAIGASVSGLAGAFYGSLISIVSPEDFSFSVSITVLSIVVLGGIGNIAGVILGSFVLTFVIFWILPHLNEWSMTVAQNFNVSALGSINFPQYTFIVYGAALILMMLLRPGGLLPSRARRIELESVETESLAAVQGIA